MPNTKNGCPAVVKAATGIYKSHLISNRSRRFDNTILMTTANYGYLDILQNWAYMADQIGLKYLVVAMDDFVFNELHFQHQEHPEIFQHIISSEEKMPTGQYKFRETAFNKISCNKFKIVLHLMNQCNVDIVFSDVDNVLFQDPFQHQMGQMIYSHQFDYLYQPNVYPEIAQKKAGTFWETREGQSIPDEANTGFYYLSSAALVIKEMLSETLLKCEEEDEYDEQHLFWSVVREARFNQSKTRPLSHCTSLQVKSILTVNDSLSNQHGKESNATRLCPLDPFYHPTGKASPRRARHWVSYHANYSGKGKQKKIDKLKKARGWNLEHLQLQQPPVKHSMGQNYSVTTKIFEV